MKYFFLFIIFTISLEYSNAQENIPDNGRYEKYYENGQLEISGNYKNKKRTDDWIEYYETGELSKKYSYNKEGEIEIGMNSFFKNGNIQSETINFNGKSLYKRYYESGTLYYEQLSENGFYKEYYEDENLKIESNYIDYELSGIWKSFFNTGEKEWEVSYINDYKEGPYKQYYPNGKLKVEGSYKKNKKSGEEKRYFENGQLEIIGSYFEGDFDKKWIIYNEAGTQTDEIKFKKGNFESSKNNSVLNAIIVPDGNIEQVPIFPGCEEMLNNKSRRDCMSNNMAMFVNKNFNTRIASSLSLVGKQRIYVIFKIDKTGNVVQARARAPHKALEYEALRIIYTLPKMIPGTQRGKEVIVPYSLPIVFMVNK